MDGSTEVNARRQASRPLNNRVTCGEINSRIETTAIGRTKGIPMATDAIFASSPYPVTSALEPMPENRNRLTTAFRVVLAIPHTLLVGASTVGANGVLGSVASVCAFFSWFAIVFTGKEPRGLWDLRHIYLSWRLRVQAYLFLLRDEYPPFGEGDYPANLALEWPEAARNHLSVGLRLIYAIPQLVVVFFLAIAAVVCTLIGWFAILVTGRLPARLAGFVRNVLRWSMRVEAYILLMRDEYPPFSLSE